MVSLDPMQMRILWYVLAGFVLGFITSTLWEWLYFRKRRLERFSSFAKGAEFTAAWRNESALPEETAYANASAPATSRQNPPRRNAAPPATSEELLWQTSAYRSPGVFLDSEKGVRRAKPAAPAPREKARGHTEPLVSEPGVTPATSAPPQVAPLETNSSPVNPPVLVLPSSADEVDATVKAILLPEPAPPPVTVVDLPTTNFVRPSGNLERSELPGAARLRATLEQAGHELPASTPAVTNLPALPPPENPSTPAPNVEIEPAAITVVNKWTVPRSAGCPDDLTKIQGIGEAYKRRLYAAGIYTWQQVANSTADQLRNVTKAKPNARPDEWKARAQELMQKFNRAEAIYDGPLPDDLTKVSGIGPTYADSLYRAGICTYEQLASVTPTELAAILPTPAIGNEFNFPDWIRQATQLANVKQKNMSLLP